MAAGYRSLALFAGGNGNGLGWFCMECKGKVLADAASCSPGSLTGVQSHGQVSYGIDKKD